MSCDDATLGGFVSGELTPTEAERLDAHLLSCDECWRAVHQDELGRRLARSLTEPAPAALAERVDAAVRDAARSAGRARRAPVVSAVLAIACAAVVVATLSRGRAQPDPPSIATVVRLARASQPAEALVRQRTPAGLAVTSERVDDRVVIMATERQPFPMPAGARPALPGTADPWVAQRGTVTLLCFNGAHPALLAGAVPAAALLALARTLNLS